MSKSESTSIQPKSIRQKRILDIAADNPGATLAEIAEQIPSVSADHVDRVLDQYGDPATSGESDVDEPPSETPNAHSSEESDSEPQDSSDHRAGAEQADQSNDQTAATDAALDSSPPTDKPDTTSQMDSDTEAEQTNSVPEPATEAEQTDSVAESATEAEQTDSVPEPATESEQTDSVAESATEAEPSTDSTARDGSGTDDESSADEPTPDPADLTQKERETLRAISYEPSATQDQIAEMLSISRATVSNRVNAIPGFDWADRGSFVEAVFDEPLSVEMSVTPDDTDSAVAPTAEKEAVTDGAPSATPDGVVDGPAPSVSSPQASDQATGSDDAETASGDDLEAVSHRLADLAERLATMEQELQASDEGTEASPLSDTDLLHKVVYACMHSDRITEEEEIQILDALMN
jgi:DNA-binding CsgD family transcriptional regulator